MMFAMDRLLPVVGVLMVVLCVSTEAYIPRFFLGRPRDGFVKPPDVSGLSQELVRRRLQNFSGAQWFEQRLDHFSPTDSRTWRQKYFQAGPTSSDILFVMIGGEGGISESWMTGGQWTKNAEQHNAVRLQLEHRFYGESRPTSDLSVENLRYLSSEQALADLANFISAKKKEVGASKVIVIGGSYSGALAAWFRLKYPYLADGAVASSAPVLAQVDFKGSLEVVAQSLNTFKPVNACDNAISDAFATMNKKMKTAEGRKELKKTLNLCQDLDTSTKQDIESLYSGLASFFMTIVQYNKISPTMPTIDDACKLMTNTSAGSTLQRLATISSKFFLQTRCLGFNYEGGIAELKNSTWSSSASYGSRQWFYQTCTEFGYYQSSDSDDQPFGHEFPVEFSTQQCADVYGEQFSSKFISGAVKATNVNYGARNYTEDRVVFVNGNIDPWHYLGITHKLPQAPVIYINGTAHCANMYTERPGDPPGLNQARKQISSLIGQWLQ